MKYNRRFIGLLRGMYNNMSRRVQGKTHKTRLYKGLPIVPRLDFYDWAAQQPEYRRLYTEWYLRGFDFAYTPSINRMDSQFGYTFDNMEFIELSKNRLDGLEKGRPKIRHLNGELHHWNKYPNEVLVQLKEGRKAGLTYQQLADNTGVSKTHVARVCKQGINWGEIH